MSLWYECGNGSARVTSGWAYKKHPLDFYICCTGPSLREVSNSDFKHPGIFTIGINTSYPYIKPDLWIGMDKPECYDSKLWWEPFRKICRGPYINTQFHGYALKSMPNTFFADVKKPEKDAEIFERRSHDIDFIWRKNTLVVALHTAIWMGAQRIHLVGCDLGGPRDYYDNRVLTDEQKAHNKKLYDSQVIWLKWFYQASKKRGIEVISCSEQSPINDIVTYKNIHESLIESRRRVPQINSEIVHAIDANRAPKKEQPKAEPKKVASEKAEIQVLNPNDKLRVFVGASEQEGVPTKVLESSIKRRATIPVGVYSLGEVMKKKGIEVPTPKDPQNRPKTNFSFHRWCIPEICDYKGKAVYCDSDQIVLEDVGELLKFFDKYPGKSVLVMSDKKEYIETSVMLIDCEKVNWDIRKIVKKLDEGSLNYKSLMFKMGLESKDNYIVGADPEWNSLDKFEQGKTKLVHYTNRGTQPYKGGKSPLTHLWIDELCAALNIGYVSKDEVASAVKNRWISTNCLQAK